MDTKIDFTHSERYVLSLRLDTDGFAFAVTDPSVREAEEMLKNVNITDEAFSAQVPPAPLHWMLTTTIRVGKTRKSGTTSSTATTSWCCSA